MSDDLEVLEVDQWTSTGDVRQIPWDDLKHDTSTIDNITGGDSEAAKRIFGGRLWFRTIRKNTTPSIGNVWFTRGEDGLPKFYAANYDSSD